MASSDLHNKDGIEYPTHTTSHNQVVAVTVADPSGEVMDNYVQLKNRAGRVLGSGRIRCVGAGPCAG